MHQPSLATSVRALRLSFTVAVIAVGAACADCGSVPDPEDPDAGGHTVGDGDGDLTLCGHDVDCPEGFHCVGGICEEAPADAGPGGDGDGDGDVDAGPPPAGQLTVLPGEDLEFGAQLIGVPVTRDVQLQNSGDAELTLLAIILDQDGAEFSVTPEGTLNEVLAPGDVLPLQVSHTPVDGTPDQAELKVLHDGPGNIATIDLFAEFKGTAAFSVSADLEQLEPSIEAYDFGEVETGAPITRTLWLRNVGALDSLIEITDLTLTPPTAGFTLEEEPDLPALLGAWSAGLCPEGDVEACPPGTDACTDAVCVDELGDPMAALPLDVTFLTEGLPGNATLTIEMDAGDGLTQHDVALTGLPTQPEIQITPGEVEFGSALVDAPNALEATVSVSNVGAGPLLITRVELPSNAAFDVDPSAPIPTQVGHPPLSLASGDAPLELTVTFLPSAAEGYASVLTLHTNDSEAAVVPVPLSGSGVVCQENAGVDAMTGECACLPGFNACGDACLADSPTTCGASCTDCTAGLGNGTDASCMMGECAYTCEERWYDLDGDLDQPDDPGWTACDYLCPSPLSEQAIAACQADPGLSCEQCNGVDDDCDGQRDEGMDPDDADLAGGNGGSCTNFSDLGVLDATTNGATNNWQYSVYPTGDDDWFRVEVKEGNNSPACAEEIPCVEGGIEEYETRFELSAPGDESYELEILVPEKTAANFDNCEGTLEAGSPLTGTDITHQWSRSSSLLDCLLCLGFDWCYEGGYGCAFTDKQVYFVRVKAASSAPQSFSCEDYTLTVTTTALD